MPFVTKDRWRGREWRAERLGLVDGRAEAVVALWGAVVRKRLLTPVSAHASLDGVHRFDLDASSRLEWTAAADLAPFETDPGELAHLAEGGAHVSCLRLSRMPDECVWQHELELPGVRLAYQPALSAEEIAEGCIRPPAVVGSYAAFALDDGRKVCHIPRPVAIDGHGNRVWGTIEIAAGISTVRFDPDALRALAWGDDGIAIYGLDTFGYTSIAGTASTWSTGYLYAWLGTVSPASDGTATTVSIYTSGSIYERQLTLGIYADNAGEPAAKTADTDGYTWTGAGSGWRTDEIDGGGVAVASATPYWLLGQAESALTTYYDAGSYTMKWDTGGHSYTHGTLVTPWPATAGTRTSRDYSIYVTYTPSAGGLSLPVAMHHYRRRRP